MTEDLRTPEQLAEEWADCFAGERRKTVAKKSFYAGYEAAMKAIQSQPISKEFLTKWEKFCSYPSPWISWINKVTK